MNMGISLCQYEYALCQHDEADESKKKMVFTAKNF